MQEIRAFAAVLQTLESSSKASRRLCTAEVRGSNPLGSTLGIRIGKPNTAKREESTHKMPLDKGTARLRDHPEKAGRRYKGLTPALITPGRGSLLCGFALRRRR